MTDITGTGTTPDPQQEPTSIQNNGSTVNAWDYATIYGNTTGGQDGIFNFPLNMSKGFQWFPYTSPNVAGGNYIANTQEWFTFDPLNQKAASTTINSDGGVEFEGNLLLSPETFTCAHCHEDKTNYRHVQIKDFDGEVLWHGCMECLVGLIRWAVNRP